MFQRQRTEVVKALRQKAWSVAEHWPMWLEPMWPSKWGAPLWWVPKTKVMSYGCWEKLFKFLFSIYFCLILCNFYYFLYICYYAWHTVAYMYTYNMYMYNLQIYIIYIYMYTFKNVCYIFVDYWASGQTGKGKQMKDPFRSCEETGLFSVPWESIGGFWAGQCRI